MVRSGHFFSERRDTENGTSSLPLFSTAKAVPLNRRLDFPLDLGSSPPLSFFLVLNPPVRIECF